MAVTYRTSLKTTRMTDVVNDIDSGAGAGYIEICTTAYGTVLATITLADPCGTVTNDVLTFDFDPDVSDTSADATGTAAVARIKNSTGTTIVDGLTVGTGSENIVLTTTSIVAGDTVTLTTGTITHG